MTDTALPRTTETAPAGGTPTAKAGDSPSRARLRWPYLTPGRAVTLCVLGYFAIAVLIYLPVGPFDARALPIAGPNNPAASDPFQMTWFLAWVPFALTHGLSIFHTNYIDYPTGVNLADNTTVPLLGIIGWPFTATLGPVATFNVLLRLSFALSATSMFFVMRRWCSSVWAASLAGLLYAFGPYTAAQELHLDLTFIPFPPLLVLLGDELLRRQRMRPAVVGLLFGVVAGLQYLVSQDVLSGCAAIALVAAVSLAIVYRRKVRARLAYIAKAVVFGVIGFGVLAGYPVLEMLVGVGHLHGPVITLAALQRTRADLLGLIIPTSHQLATPSYLSHFGDEFVVGNLSENGSYLGIPLLLLLGVIVRKLRRDATVITFLWLAIAAFVLSLGPYLVIGTWRSPLPLPEYLYEHLPLLQNTIPARYSLYVLLFVSMIVGIGLDRLWFAPRTSLARGPLRSGAPVGSSKVPLENGGTVWQPGETGPIETPGAKPHLKRRTLPWHLDSSGRRWGFLAGALVIVSVLPNVPFASRGLPWSANLPKEVERVVEPGTVVLAYPFTTPESTQPMVWAATDHMDFRLMGGYANIDVPGQVVGRRWPPLLRPASVQDILGYVPIGDRFPQPPRRTPAIEAQLRGYLKRYSIGAVVAWTGRTSQPSDLITPAGVYTYLRQALGEPQVRGDRFAIWLPVHGNWLPPPA